MENGYDLPDPMYLLWLQRFHPAEAKKLATSPSLESPDPIQVSSDPKRSTRVHKYPTRSSGKTLSTQAL